MPDRCVAGGCSNTRDKSKNISLHVIPFFGDERSEAKKRRKRWIDFIAAKRANFQPSKRSMLCSEHFKKEDFAQVEVEGYVSGRKCLKEDELGVNVFPTINKIASLVTSVQTDRDKRMTIRSAKRKTETATSSETVEKQSPAPELMEFADENVHTTVIESEQEDMEVSGEQCDKCATLEKELRLANNKIKTLRDLLNMRRNQVKTLQRKVNNFEEKQMKTDICEAKATEGIQRQETSSELEDELAVPSSSIYETESSESFTEDSESSVFDETTTDIRTERKHIVFLSQLRLLFKFCHICKFDNPEVTVSDVGTAVVVKTVCHNQECKAERTWHSQLYLPGTQILAGNFLICYSTLLAGGSATKVFRVLNHMGLCCVSMKTFFKYQNSMIFPAIYLFWEKYQMQMLSDMMNSEENIVIAGDGRHDSMGHSAKFGAYTMFSCTDKKIIHFSLVQRNEAGSSTAIELMAFQRCLADLLQHGLTINTFISDRHASIAKYLRSDFPSITHYFDIWHLKKKIRKVLTRLSRLKGFEEIGEWIKSCERHLYWSATSTPSGNGDVIYAKFRAFTSHVINKHTDLDDPFFNKCSHGQLGPKKWLKPGPVHDQLCTALQEKNLVKGIKKASPLAQTSCVEGFHSLLNHFSPKMLAYSYPGMYCRHILAAVHFNYNLQRSIKVDCNGLERVKISYPKFKNGEATVKEQRIKPSFEYVGEIFEELFHSSTSNKEHAAKKLLNMTPEPMNTMLVKQSKEEAISRHKKRKQIATEEVLPTIQVSEAEQVVRSQPKQVRKCSICREPMKGHKFVTTCPKNQK